MALLAQEKRKCHRWKCEECGMINRAYRTTCFGTDCTMTKQESCLHQQQQPPSTNHVESFVEFKDENSKVTSRLPSILASAIKADINCVVQGLMQSEIFTKNKHENLCQTSVLQRQMRKGFQVRQDFENVEGALWGYARRKFSIRAMIAFELFRSAQEVLPTDSVLNNAPTVISIGGGPGNDMFGYLLFRKHWQKVIGKQTGLHVLDFAPGWAPIVSRVGQLSGHDIQFQTCDLSDSLENTTNTCLKNLVSSKTPLVFVLCYVVSEVMGPHGQVPPLLQQLLAIAKDAVFLFREPHPQALRNLLRQYPHWCQGKDYWHLSNNDGLVVSQQKSS